jgi:hypothetical protein
MLATQPASAPNTIQEMIPKLLLTSITALPTPQPDVPA